MKKRLTGICENGILAVNEGAVFQEPYIPYIPDKWNGVLVLAEAQNLAKSNDDYVAILKAMNRKQKIERLYYAVKTENRAMIQPWDDGSLKLAIESALKVKACYTAVSNAVLWSQRSNTANINPSKFLMDRSARIWKEFLLILRPKIVITAGKKAEYVIKKSCWSGQHIKLRLPAKTAMSRVSGMFQTKDLLKRYPEVNRVVIENPTWVKEYKQNKIFFACHAVSIINEI